MLFRPSTFLCAYLPHYSRFWKYALNISPFVLWFILFPTIWFLPLSANKVALKSPNQGLSQSLFTRSLSDLINLTDLQKPRILLLPLLFCHIPSAPSLLPVQAVCQLLSHLSKLQNAVHQKAQLQNLGVKYMLSVLLNTFPEPESIVHYK